MKKIIIAIDGNSGCGKSTTARVVAKKLGYLYIDSGAMYRAVTLYFIRHEVNFTDTGLVRDKIKHIDITFSLNANSDQYETILNGENVETAIRTLAVTQKVSPVSAIPEVRRAMVALQRELGKHKGVVMDGRDIGTVVFPEAELKVFMTADLAIRAKRRVKEMEEKGIPSDFQSVFDNLKERDHIDSTRADSPLKKADGAYELDTSSLTFDEQVNKILVKAFETIKSI